MKKLFLIGFKDLKLVFRDKAALDLHAAGALPADPRPGLLSPGRSAAAVPAASAR